jgi:SAM-dependent methyltransferase
MSGQRPPSLLAQLHEYVFPLELYLQVFLKGIIPTLLHMATHPWHIPFPSRWRDSFLAAGQPFLLAMADKMYASPKRKLLSQAKGRVLEVGAGTGETVKYYDRSKVDVVYGVEPNLAALGDLRGQVVKFGMEDKYEILPFGVEDERKMSAAGVMPGSIDTIVCVPIPTPAISADIW